MNPEVKTKWVAALRSGDYKQGTSYLNKNGKLCCLGVLCEVAVSEGIVTRNKTWEYTTYAQASTSPPPEVIEWAGIEDEDPNADGTTLMTLNDEQRKDFNYIADVIEREL